MLQLQPLPPLRAIFLVTTCTTIRLRPISIAVFNRTRMLTLPMLLLLLLRRTLHPSSTLPPILKVNRTETHIIIILLHRGPLRLSSRLPSILTVVNRTETHVIILLLPRRTLCLSSGTITPITTSPPPPTMVRRAATLPPAHTPHSPGIPPRRQWPLAG